MNIENGVRNRWQTLVKNYGDLVVVAIIGFVVVCVDVGFSDKAMASSVFWKLVLVFFVVKVIVALRQKVDFGLMLSGWVGNLLTIGFVWIALMMAGLVG